MPEQWSHWTARGTIWIERRVLSGPTELFCLWFKGEDTMGKEISFGCYMSAERAVDSIAAGEHDFQTLYDFEPLFALTKLGIPRMRTDWNGLR